MSAENCGNSKTVLCVINPKITQKKNLLFIGRKKITVSFWKNLKSISSKDTLKY